MRHGYYNALNESYGEYTKQDVTLSHEHAKHEHIVHCFDYLRQSAQCNSNKNVEPVDFERGGATGWGVEHQCSDFGKLVEYAVRWEIHDSNSPYRHGASEDA